MLFSQNGSPLAPVGYVLQYLSALRRTDSLLSALPPLASAAADPPSPADPAQAQHPERGVMAVATQRRRRCRLCWMMELQLT